MCKRFFFLCCYCVLFQTEKTQSQSLFKPDYIEPIVHCGFVVKNYPTFPQLNNPVLTESIRIGTDLNGYKPWHKYYHYPSFGIQIIHSYLGNSRQLGSLTAAVPEMTFHFPVNSKWIFSSALGLGVSYCSKPFNINSNNDNILIGSHITFFALSEFGLEYKLNSEISYVMNMSAFHASNAHTKLPNVGANILSAGLGIVFRPHGIKERKIQENNIEFYTQNSFTIRTGYGFHQRGEEKDYRGTQYFPVYVQQFYFAHNYHPIAKYQMGLETFFKESVYDTIRTSGFYEKNQRSKAWSVLFILGHELLMGHFSLLTQGGLYIYNPYYRAALKEKEDADLRDHLKGLFTSRIGFNYYFKDATVYKSHQFFTGIYIKTNFSGADFLETGLGYVF